MKRFFFALLCLFIYISNVQAQNDTVLYMTNHPLDVEVCLNQFSGATIYGPECQDYLWTVRYNSGYEQHPEGNPINITGVFDDFYSIQYNGCGFSWGFNLHFIDDRYVPNSFTQEIWKHQNETITLEAVGADSTYWYTYLWLHSNENTRTVDITNDIIYTVQIYDLCGTAIRNFNVKNNVELTSASCDLATGYNMLEWETTAQQATYVQSVNIYYDYDENCTYSELVANVDYNAGSYVDTSHDSYQYPCQYHVVAVGYDGEECPLRSYWCRTISLSDLMGTQGTQTLQWTSYTTERDIVKQTTSVLAYQIYDVINGEAFYKATVGSFANTYNYDPSDFNGHGGVAAVLDGAKDGEAMAFARTRYKIGDPDGTEENHQNSTFVIYPNPATSGVINIRAMEQGDHNLTITNVMGQVIYSGVINGVFTSQRLTPGVYTVLCNGSAQKVVVE